MKKLLLVFTLFFSGFSHASQMDQASLRCQLRNNFKGLDTTAYNQAVGYNLRMTLHHDDRPEVVGTIPSVAAHGWGSGPQGPIEYARLVGPHRIPGDVVTFEFKDCNNGYNPFFIMKSSLGQQEDVKALLTTLVAVWKCGFDGCNVFGQSRGAATVVNTLAMLNSLPSGWDSGFDDIKNLLGPEINNIIRGVGHYFNKGLLDMIKRGVVVLDTPMVSPQAGLNAHAHYVLRGVFFEKNLADFINNYVLPVITIGNYNPEAAQALTSIKNMPKGLKVLVSYQKDDPAVGNVHDHQFAQELIARLGANNVWIVLGNDCKKPICATTWAALVQAKKDGVIKRSLRRFISAHNAGHFTLLESGVLNALFAMLDCSHHRDEQKMVATDFFDQFQPQRFNADLTDYFKPENYSKNEYVVSKELIDQLDQEENQQKKKNQKRWLSLSGMLLVMTLLSGWYNYCSLR